MPYQRYPRRHLRQNCHSGGFWKQRGVQIGEEHGDGGGCVLGPLRQAFIILLDCVFPILQMGLEL